MRSLVDSYRDLADEYALQVGAGSMVVELLQALARFMEEAADGFEGFRVAMVNTRAEWLRWMKLKPPGVTGVKGTQAIMTWMDALENWYSRMSEFIKFEFWKSAIDRMANAFISGFQRMTLAIVKNVNNMAAAIKDFFTAVVDSIIAELARLAALEILRWLMRISGFAPIGLAAAEASKQAAAYGSYLNPRMMPSAGAPGMGGGPVYNFNGPVYGFNDFKKKVDEANRANSRGRVG